MKPLLAILAFLGVAGAAVFGAACGGDEEEAPRATEPAGGEPTRPSGDEGGGADLGDLQDLVGSIEDATFKVTLELSGDAAAELGEGEMVWYQKPPRTRFDIRGTSDGDEFSFSLINTPDASYMCTSIPGAGGACFQSEGDVSSEMPFTGLTDIVEGLDEEITAGDVEVGGRSERRIAGVDAVCWEVKSPEGDGTFCASKSGVPLLIEVASAEGTFRLEATDFSDDVSDGDFEPPYEVTEGGPFGLPGGDDGGE